MTLAETYSRAAHAIDSHSERIKFFGWYLHVHRERERFSQTDIRNCYDEVHIEKPQSLSPWFKSLHDRSPKLLLRDGDGYRLERTVRDQFTRLYGGKVERATTPIAKSLAAHATKVLDAAERAFIEEAVVCINHSASRAAIVLGWCAAIHRLRKKVESLGFAAFNAASTRLKNQTTGKYKRWNKEFSVSSFGELQTSVFDTDLIVVLESLGVIDGTESQRLETCFGYRCHSAHPGNAPIGDAHVVAFFSDITDIVLANPSFN